MPTDTQSNDLWNWQIQLSTHDTQATISGILLKRHYRLVSTTVVELPDDSLGFSKVFMARDPDGHALLFTEHQDVRLVNCKDSACHATNKQPFQLY